MSRASNPALMAFVLSWSGVSEVRKAMDFPSGDQAYFRTPLGASMSGSASPWPSRKLNRWGFPRLVERKVRTWLSGDQAAAMFMSGPLVTAKH